MITFFKRGVIWKNDRMQKVVYLAQAHTSLIHRGQRFYIEYNGDEIRITHGPSGAYLSNTNFKFKEHDRPEDIERKIKQGLDKNWFKILAHAKEICKGCKWRWSNVR